MTIRFFQADGTTLDGATFAALEAGQISTPLTVHVRADGAEHHDVMLLQRVESPDTAGTWLAQGVPPQDELWGRIRVVGEDNAADPTWTAPRTDWQPVGAFAGVLLPRIPDGASVICEWAQQPPSSAEVETYRWGLTALYNEHARPLPPSHDLYGRGVAPGTGDGTTSLVLRGLEVTASPAPDDEVHVSGGTWLHHGVTLGDISRSAALDQTDSEGAALASGEAYLALLSRGADPTVLTVTKGAKAAAPVAPADPDEAVLEEVRVEYQAGGTSVLGPEDLTPRSPRGRFEVRAGVGRQIILAPGRAAAGATERYASLDRLLVPNDDATSWVWLLGSGHPQLTADADRPEAGALLLAEVDVAAGAVTEIRDRRTYLGGEVVITLSGAAGAAPLLVEDLLFEHELLFLEAITFRLSDHAGATASETVADLEVDGTTIFTDQATEDLRPRIAWDAADLVDRAAIPQVTELRPGLLLAFHLDQVATDAAPARAELQLICRRG